MPPKGWKDIPLREEDFQVIEAYAKENDLKNGAAVKRAFKIAFGVKFPEPTKA
jgi:hypothetical protein